MTGDGGEYLDGLAAALIAPENRCHPTQPETITMTEVTKDDGLVSMLNDMVPDFAGTRAGWLIRNAAERIEADRTALATARAEAEALRSEVEKLRALLDGVASFLEVAPLGSGVCCCGDPIEGHSYYSGHSPVDQASYTAGLWAKDIRTALGERL